MSKFSEIPKTIYAAAALVGVMGTLGGLALSGDSGEDKSRSSQNIPEATQTTQPDIVTLTGVVAVSGQSVPLEVSRHESGGYRKTLTFDPGQTETVHVTPTPDTQQQ